MAHVLHLQQTDRRTLGRVRAAIRAILNAAGAEHRLALRAATKAALQRQSLAELRAMYLSPLEPTQADGALAQNTKSETASLGRPRDRRRAEGLERSRNAPPLTAYP